FFVDRTTLRDSPAALQLRQRQAPVPYARQLPTVLPPAYQRKCRNDHHATRSANQRYPLAFSAKLAFVSTPASEPGTTDRPEDGAQCVPKIATQHRASHSQ